MKTNRTQEGVSEMKPVIQSTLILAATLVLGFLVGAFATGALERHRMARVEQLRERGGFIEHMERTIEPRDQEQRSAILPILEATAQRNRLIIDSARADLRIALEEMIAELEPLLDPAQLRRITEVARFADPFRPPPRPEELRPGDRPPPGAPPPPPR